MLILVDGRDITKFSYVIDLIPGHIRNAKPRDKDLLTEIQRIESFPKPLFDRVVTHNLYYKMAQRVVDWLQVGSNSFLRVKRIDHPMTDGKLVRHRAGRNHQKTTYQDGWPVYEL